MTLRPLSSFSTTVERPVSDPVPAVVGMAMVGSGALADCQSRRPSAIAHMLGPSASCAAISAMVLPASRDEPPPNAITPSHPAAFSAATPSRTLALTGLGLISENSVVAMPSTSLAAMASITIGIAARPGSVTSRGREMSNVLQARASIETLPAPNQTVVGKLQVPRSVE